MIQGGGIVCFLCGYRQLNEVMAQKRLMNERASRRYVNPTNAFAYSLVVFFNFLSNSNSNRNIILRRGPIFNSDERRVSRESGCGYRGNGRIKGGFFRLQLSSLRFAVRI